MSAKSEAIEKVIALAGGRVVGKTRLQKAVFVLELAGLGFDFDFTYHHFGPYSEELKWAAREASTEGRVIEFEEQARWGGSYSVFTLSNNVSANSSDPRDLARAEILSCAVDADAVVLELAATAALLKEEGVADYWEETKRRKPLKATPDAIGSAKLLWEQFRKVKTPVALVPLN